MLFTVALTLASRHSVCRTDRGVRAGLLVASVGSGLLLVGTLIEFYGVLLQDDLNAQAGHQAGRAEHWLGSHIGWLFFGAGMLVVLVGGLITALALRRRRTDATWLPLFAAGLGIGVLAGNLLGLAPAFLSVPVLALYGIGWISFGSLLLSGTGPFAPTPPGRGDPALQT